MDQSLPSFRKPPVIEAALSVQFQPLKGMSNAYLGLFWSRVRQTYPKLHDADPIEPQIERFGTDVPRARLPHLRIAAAHPAARLRMSSNDGHLMLQLQNGRLVFNWLRLDGGDYPRWTEVEPRFHTALRMLEAFVKDEKLGAIEPNQWEVTYVNHLVREREWLSQADWRNVLPGVIGTTDMISCGDFETIGTRMSYVLPNESGRLHIELSHGFTGPDDDASELLVLQFTARGGIGDGQDLAAGLKIGHEAIVRSFTQITGTRVRKEIWEQEDTER